MGLDTKIAIVVRDDLANWQRLNVAAFLAGGLVGSYPELAGERYTDASGRIYGCLVRQPILIFAGSSMDLRSSLERCLQCEVQPSIYTHTLFSTGNDLDNRNAVACVPTNELDLVGLGIHADRKLVNRIVKGLSLHP